MASATEPFPPLTEQVARTILAGEFGLAPTTLRRLPSEQDDTFRVDAPGGRFIFKATGPHGDRGEQESQVRILDHLARADPALPVPRAVRALSGATVVDHEDEQGRLRLVRMMSHLPGTMLSAEPESSAPWAAVGAIAARMDRALSSLDTAPFDRELLWDLQTLGARGDLLQSVGTEARPTVDRLVRSFAADVAPALSALPRQVIHNDLNRDNLLLDPTDSSTISGILDFGDAVVSHRVIEVALAMAYAVPADSTAPWDAPAQVLRGYQTVSPLTPGERSLLPALVRARHAQRLILNAYLADTLPQSADYTSRNLVATWRQLDALLSVDPPRFDSPEELP
jgi:Ser/Thr protein kinase RdoA (MazF antagonist)